MRIVYRQTQEIPFEKWMQELELERATDENEEKLGHPLPKRYRMFSGAEHSQMTSSTTANSSNSSRRTGSARRWKWSATISTTGSGRSFCSLTTPLT